MLKTSEIGSMAVSREGLNYLVPSKWYEEFYKNNKQITNIQDLQVHPLKLSNHVDTFLMEFIPHIKQELQQKCNYLHLQAIRISPEIKNNISWTPVQPVLWKHINKKLKESHPVMTYLSQHILLDITSTIQIQLIFCSKTRSDAFIGYFPKTTNLIAVIRQIGLELGYVEVSNSKLNFLQRNPQISFSYNEIGKYSLQDAPHLLLMAFNLQRKEEDQQRDELIDDFGQFLFSKPDNMNESNEAVMGDQNTMEDDANPNNPLLNEPINNRTMSTGAETPFSFALSNGFDLDRQYRVNELFGAKEPQQIEQMRQYANKKINYHQSLIKIPESPEAKYKIDLEKLAEELFEGIHKRKNHKQKQKQLQLAYE